MLPFTLLPVSPIVKTLAAPQYAVVIFALPLKDDPLMVRAVCRIVAVAAFPVQARAVVAAPLGEEEPA